MSAEKAKGRVLLPSHVVPDRYDLALTPNLEAFTFHGKCAISMHTTDKLTDENAMQVTLHAKELGFESAFYTVEGSTDKVMAEEIRVNLKATTVTFCFGKAFEKDSKLVLTIQYTGFLNNQMAGFYRSSYTDIDGNEKIMASTQFESLDARRCFPCVDEPAAKAVFGVTFTVDSHLTCFSNMPEASRLSLPASANNSRHKTTIRFMDSPKMSTYLLAFCVGEFDHVQALSGHGVVIKVYTPPGKSETGRFALECATRCLDAYDDLFGSPYPLPKLDMVAIPEFAMGAMENWGLVTYREVDLLIDPETASSSQKQRVCVVVTHELAHQWFGNLVTMMWWDDLWLNEGFASWCENWACHTLFPEWEMWEQFVTGHYNAALRLDALKSSHPIQVPIHHAEEVEQVFDAISYCKGSAVVRMIKAVLGMKAFQTGLAAYMKKHAYGNTETSDLWSAWEESSGMPIGEMMKSWTEQMGFPLLRVTKETWEDTQVTLELDQVWFLSDGSEIPAADADKKWTIPIMTCTEEGTQPDMTFMREKTATVTIPLKTTNGWVKLNAGQEVPMRVLCTPEMLKRLSFAIESKSLPTADRAGLLMDAYALVKAGRMAADKLIELLSSYRNETDYIVWTAIETTLYGLDAVLSEDETISAHFSKFARKFAVELSDYVGWDAGDDDGHLTVLLRSSMVNLLSRFAYDDPMAVKEAESRFAAFQDDHSDVKQLPSDIRVPVFKMIVKNGGEAEYNAVKAYFDAAADNAEKKHVLGSIGATMDPKLKLATMEWSISGAIKLQDFFYAMRSVGASGKDGREISWQFLQDKFKKIHGMLKTASPSLMSAVISSCSGSFCTEEKADEIEAFFKEHPLPSCARQIAQNVENIRANAKFAAILKASDLSKEDFWEKL